MKKFFNIGGLRMLLEYESGDHDIFLEKSLKSFTAKSFEEPDIRFLVDTMCHFPLLDSFKKIFTSNPAGLWTLLEDQQKIQYIITLQHVARETQPYRIITADRQFSDFTIYLGRYSENLLFPLEYPFVDLAVSGHININKVGVILHSACVSVQGKGYLFAGSSGAGKSTISEIWQKNSEAEVLTDERVIIREYQGDIWAFGTPWHGSSEIHQNKGTPIKEIFFIKPSKKNRVIPISKTDAASRLIVRCFPTFWNMEGMQFAVDFCSKVARAKESSELEFVNDPSVVEYMMKLND